MTHRVVSSVVGLVVLLFVAAALVFAWAVAARTPRANDATPRVPHPVAAQSADCVRCHAAADGTAPLTHRRFADDGCTACHPVRPAMPVPHTVAMGDERCVLCHGDPALELGLPPDHLAFSKQRCTFCHRERPSRADVQPAPAGVSALPAPAIGHAVDGAFATCLHCHRVGDEPSLPPSHRMFGADTCRFLCHLRE